MERRIVSNIRDIVYEDEKFRFLKDHIKVASDENIVIKCMWGSDLKKISRSAANAKLKDRKSYIARLMNNVTFDDPDWKDKLCFYHTEVNNKYYKKKKNAAIREANIARKKAEKEAKAKAKAAKKED